MDRWGALAQTQILFCTQCGVALVEGACPRHPEESGSLRRTAEPAARARTSTVPVWVPLVSLIVLLVATSTGWFVTLGALHDRDRAAAELQRQVESVRRQLNDQVSALSGVSDRLNELRAQVESKPELSELAERVERSVFTVADVGSGAVAGSGFVVRGKGGRSLVVTNFHVVSDQWLAGQSSVALRQADQTFFGNILRVSEAADLAVISVPQRFPSLQLADTSPVPGDTVLVIGSPLGLEGTVTTGVVSALRGSYLQFSAPISPGNSGGPVVNEAGEVVGVATEKFVGPGVEGLSFAVSVETLCGSVLSC